MNVAFRIALAELVTFVLLFTQIVIPVITYADESAHEGASTLAVGETEVIAPILTDTLTNSLSGSSPIFSTDSNRIDTVSSRDLSSESEIRGPQIDIIPTR